VAFRIAFDLDGVLADMEAELRRQARILYGDRTKSRDDDPPAPAATPAAAGDEPSDAPGAVAAPVVKLDLTHRQLRRLWRHVASIENFWESLNEIEPGAVARLGAIAAEHRWEVIFLTKRPESAGATAQVQSQRWLEAKGFRLPSVYVVQGSRGRIASALGLDVVVDDRSENCLDVRADSRARAILVCRDDDPQAPEAAKRLGIGVVKSVGECLDILTEINAGKSNGGIIGRMMRRLGFKQAASL